MDKQKRHDKIFLMLAKFVNLVLLNVFFVIFQLPLIVYLVLASQGRITLSVFILVFLALPLTASLLAEFNAVYVMLNKEDSYTTKFFFQQFGHYAVSSESLPVYLIVYAVIGILLAEPLLKTIPALALFSPMYVVLLLVLVGMVPFLCMEITVFRNTFLNTLVNAFVLLFMNWRLTLFNIAYLFVTLIVMQTFPAAILFFIWSSLCVHVCRLL